jgi:hypothetical protein
MTMQPGLPPLPAFGGVQQELGRDVTDEFDEPGSVQRDADGEPVGQADRDADVRGADSTTPAEQTLNEEALDEFAARYHDDKDR